MDYVLGRIADTFNGHVNGNEATFCCPLHNDNSPSAVATLKPDGSYACNCLSGCDAKDLHKYLRESIPEMQTTTFVKSVKKASVRKYLDHVPAGMPERPETFSKEVTITHIYDYRNRENISTGLFVYRGLNQVGKKDIRPVSAVESNDGAFGWSWSRDTDKCPIYGLENVAGDRPMLIVEGEKCVNAAKRHLPDWDVISWCGGSGNWHKVSWSSIDWAPTKIVLWPDNDVPGEKWALNGGGTSLPLYMILQSLGHEVEVVNPRQTNWERGYDIADAILDEKDLDKILNDAVNPDAIALEDVYSNCSVARAQKLKTNELEDYKCGTHDLCAGCMFLHSELIQNPIDFKRVDSFMYNYIYMEDNDKFYGLRSTKMHPERNFDNIHRKTTVHIDEGKARASQLFLENEDTLRVSCKTFRPGEGDIMVDSNGNKMLNKWRTSLLNQEVNQEAWGMWWELLATIVPNENERNHLLDWMAWTIQHPEKKINHQIMFISPQQGVGKDTLFTPLAQYLSIHAADVEVSELKSDFTQFLDGKKLLFLQELSTARGNMAEKLKSLCASTGISHLNINKKGEQPYKIPNYLSLVAFSNKHLPFYLDDQKDRRWFVINFDSQPKSPEWFAKFHKILKEGTVSNTEGYVTHLSPGITAIVQHLLARDVSDFAYGGNAPETEAKKQIADDSRPQFAAFRDMIADHTPPFNYDVIPKQWFDNALKEHFPETRPTMSRVLHKELGLESKKVNISDKLQPYLKCGRNGTVYIIRDSIDIQERPMSWHLEKVLQAYTSGSNVSHTWMYAFKR